MQKTCKSPGPKRKRKRRSKFGAWWWKHSARRRRMLVWQGWLITGEVREKGPISLLIYNGPCCFLLEGVTRRVPRSFSQTPLLDYSLPPWTEEVTQKPQNLRNTGSLRYLGRTVVYFLKTGCPHPQVLYISFFNLLSLGSPGMLLRQPGSHKTVGAFS